jgi:hypothetical protein
MLLLHWIKHDHLHLSERFPTFSRATALRRMEYPWIKARCSAEMSICGNLGSGLSLPSFFFCQLVQLYKEEDGSFQQIISTSSSPSLFAPREISFFCVLLP